MSEILPDTRSRLEKRYRVTAFVVMAQIAFTLALIPTAWFLAVNTENAVMPTSLTSLWIAVLSIALATFVLRRTLYRWDRLKDVVLLKGVDGLLSTLQVNAIILGAMAQIIAIFGFLIAALGGVKFDMFRAAVVALVVFLINFPRKSIWEKIVGNLQSA